MSRLTIPLLVVGAALAAACGNSTLIDEERTFAADTWNRFTPEVFKLKVDDAEKFYNIDFSVTIDTTLYRYDRMPLVIDIHYEDGTHRHLEPQLAVRENGRWKGEKDGTFRTVSARVFNYFSFNYPGTYDYEVKQGTSQYDLEGIRSLRVTMTEAKLDYGQL